MNYIKKQNILIIIFAIILIIIIITIIVLSFGQKKHLQESTVTPTPSTSLPSANSTVEYNKEKSNELISKLKSRQSISQTDMLAKEKIFSRLPAGQLSGVVYKTGTITIDYVNSANIFQVEILTKDIGSAKSEAVAWFNSQGVSQQGICNFPVQFYLNYEVSQSLNGSGVVFSPLAEGC